MTQAPVSVKVNIPSKVNMAGRPGVVQILHTNPLPGQELLQQTTPTFKAFANVRPLITNATPMAAVNTNTAVQYVRKQPEVTVISHGSPYVTASLGQQFTPFGAPILTLNPNIVQPMTGPPGLTPGGVNQLGGSSGPLTNLTNSRKPCNCTKSHCLKLYCECFAQGQLCQNCNCHNCMNNLAYEEERGRAIKMTLERNPTAFHPKIGRGEGERKHTKGCNCKRSGCLKNYCECYEAKISCSDLCRCQGCRNTEDSVERRSLMRLAAMGSLRSRQPSSFKKHLSKPPPETSAQAEEAERRDLAPAAQERIVLEEFGRILERVMDSASKAHIRTASSIQDDDSEESEQPLIHAPVPTVQSDYTRVGGSRTVGAATASAAAADVLLRDDEDDDDLMQGMDDHDQRDLDDMFEDDDDEIDPGRTSHHAHPPRHTRQAVSRQGLSSSRNRSSHVSDLLDERMISDDDSDEIPSKHPENISQTYRQVIPSRNRTHLPETRYRSRHSRRHASGTRGHEHHDPDSII
ncbi:Protein lin-54 [Clonorchis sinensis]|uniref:Protein lin-54 n=1 Tax=Clonorchis sinensis TaxID=79923 RepID=A0A3R7JVV9_CLOSI|nr:Protein lin-54 [Clonorchis sinensis]